MRSGWLILRASIRWRTFSARTSNSKEQPYIDFGRGTIWQRDEAPLELTRAHVFELNDAFISLHGENKVYATPDFTLVPRGTPETQYPPELRAKPKAN